MSAKELIEFVRDNPVKFLEDFYGVKLHWYQSLMLHAHPDRKGLRRLHYKTLCNLVDRNLRGGRTITKSSLDKDFNPFYDSHFLISYDNNEKLSGRLLVELWPEELIQLRDEINCVLKETGHYDKTQI